MKGEVCVISIEEADKAELSEMKSWFFKENIRIQQEKDMLLEERRYMEAERKQLEEERRCLKEEEARLLRIRKRLDKDNELFDQKTEVLIRELRRLADDKDKLLKDKERFAREKAAFVERKNRETKRRSVSEVTPRMFFEGVNSEVTLKKRYRELLKIFHPDNLCGNADIVVCINKEYDALKNIYQT